MALTVAQALDLPVFASACLVAGEAGLNNRINWVHVVDMANPRYQWERQGVLLLTTGFGLQNQPEQQQSLVTTLSQLGFVGLVLSTGHFFAATPALMIQEADRLGLPIIETPPELLFISMTEAILERIINQQYTLLQQSAKINQQLTELVLQGADLSELTNVLANLLQRAIAIESPTFQVLASAHRGTVDQARDRCLEDGRATPQVIEHLLNAGVYSRLLNEMQPLYVSPIPALGMTMERVVAPIIVNRELHGYIWIISGDRPLTPLDELALSHGATVAALILFKEQSVRKAQADLQGDFLTRLLKGEPISTPLLEQAQRLNYQLDRPHQICLICPQPPLAGGASLQEEVSQWLHRHQQSFLIAWRDDWLVVILEGSSFEQEQQVALSAQLSHPHQQIFIGLSQPTTEAPHSLRQGYEQAREALQIGLALGNSVTIFDQLGLLHWLYHLPPEQRDENAYLQHVRTLATYDAKRQTQLLATLEAYLDNSGSIADTAAVLYVHRNTLLRRLERIETLCNLNLRTASVRFNLYAALKGDRLFEGIN